MDGANVGVGKQLKVSFSSKGTKLLGTIYREDSSRGFFGSYFAGGKCGTIAYAVHKSIIDECSFPAA